MAEPNERSFMDIVVDEDWGNDDVIDVLLTFISSHELDAALAKHAASLALKARPGD